MRGASGMMYMVRSTMDITAVVGCLVVGIIVIELDVRAVWLLYKVLSRFFESICGLDSVVATG